MLLADGTVLTYFALPPDYPFEPAPLPLLPQHLLPRAAPDLWPPQMRMLMPTPMQTQPHDARRKHPADQDEGFPRHPKQPRLDGPHQLPPHAAVDRHALRRAFLKYAKILNESSAQRRSYLEGGRVPCLACGRFGDPTLSAAFFLASFLVSLAAKFLCWFLAIVELALTLT
jgi:hypothetical protein